MQIAKVVGTFYPETIEIKSEGGPTLHWRDPALNVQVDLAVHFEGKQVTVVCNLIELDLKKNSSNLLVVANNMAQTAVDLISFKTSEAPTILWRKFHFPDGSTTDIQSHERTFFGLAKSIDSDEAFSKMFAIALQEPETMLALRDLIDTVRFTYTAEVNCARAVEAIRNYFVPKGLDRKHGWKPMRDALNVSEAYTRYVIESSRLGRHGKRSERHPDLLEIGKRTWMMMDRYFAYRLRGDQSLPIADFPLLD